MTKPFVGLPTVSGAGCAYAPDLGEPFCGKGATVHVLAESPAWGIVALPSCDLHAPVARTAAGEVLGEHPHQPTCLVADCWAGLYPTVGEP